METPQNKPPLEVIKALYEQGLFEQAQLLETKFGLSYIAVERHLDEFATQDPICLKIKHNVRILADCQDTVLIRGETGTGKELIARALHGLKKGAFIAINCAGMPKELIESELFGYAAGSFTGAKGDKDGLIHAAANGTLFLDEIGDLPIDMQAKLLRVMQEMTVRRVGSNKEESISCRFVAATHRNLEQMLVDDKFRRDLYARLSVFVLDIPPLQDRTADIPLIVARKDKTKTFPTDAVDWNSIDLTLNVRAIEHLIRRFVVLGEKPTMKKV